MTRATSPAPATRAISAGRRSTWAAKTVRAAAEGGASGVMTWPSRSRGRSGKSIVPFLVRRTRRCSDSLVRCTRAMAATAHRGVTRRAVAQAAADVVATHGLDALSVRRVAGRLGVWPTTVMHHAGGSREGLVALLIEHL